MYCPTKRERDLGIWKINIRELFVFPRSTLDEEGGLKRSEAADMKSVKGPKGWVKITQLIFDQTINALGLEYSVRQKNED